MTKAKTITAAERVTEATMALLKEKAAEQSLLCKAADELEVQQAALRQVKFEERDLLRQSGEGVDVKTEDLIDVRARRDLLASRCESLARKSRGADKFVVPQVTLARAVAECLEAVVGGPTVQVAATVQGVEPDTTPDAGTALVVVTQAGQSRGFPGGGLGVSHHGASQCSLRIDVYSDLPGVDVNIGSALAECEKRHFILGLAERSRTISTGGEVNTQHLTVSGSSLAPVRVFPPSFVGDLKADPSDVASSLGEALQASTNRLATKGWSPPSVRVEGVKVNGDKVTGSAAFHLRQGFEQPGWAHVGPNSGMGTDISTVVEYGNVEGWPLPCGRVASISSAPRAVRSGQGTVVRGVNLTITLEAK